MSPSGGSATGPRSREAFSFTRHPRRLGGRRYVYAVLSRRARGVSVGINLNPDKVCNFDCLYCQVDRTVPPPERQVDEQVLLAELDEILRLAAAGRLDALASLEGVAPSHRRLADVAFSGDGEPTSYPRWAELVTSVGDVIERSLPGTPMTLITNASLFHRPRVRAGLDALAARGGRVWAKLDAGTEDFYRHVAVTKIPFSRILDNIEEEARRRPLVIQSLFFEEAGRAPAVGEIEAYAARLSGLVAAGGGLQAVQLTTVARRPPRPEIRALDAVALEAIARVVRAALPAVDVEIYPASAEGTPG
ncbi:MAG: radical SAM protein [Acidobacteriota bacterium]|nr:radical SAM protein [Acidobacteriota bacterium]MDQ7086942.1 radical SAM protein [Acidobacteriota bacterium]